jgi:hypothetical protein
MKVANNPAIHQQLFAEAMLAKREAIETIRALSNSRYNGERRWDEYLSSGDREAQLRQMANQANQANG